MPSETRPMQGWRWLCVVVGIVWGVSSAAAFGQTERYELGVRLRRFELAWEEAEPVVRRRSLGAMEAAVSRFFSFRLREAARQLDEAWLVSQSEHPDDRLTRWLISHRIDCGPRLMDATTRSLSVSVVPFYEVASSDKVRPGEAEPGDTESGEAESGEAESGEAESGEPPAVQLRLRLRRLGETGLVDGTSRETAVPLASVREAYRWEHGVLEAGDYRLSVTAHVAGRPALEVGQLTVSYCERLDERLRACREASEALGDTATATGAATVRVLGDQLAGLAAGKVPEADVPADRRLRFCEELIAAGGRSPLRLNSERPGDYFVSLGRDDATLPARLNVPRGAKRPLPVLIVFHGAGGSENMFFETCGAGRLVTLAETRGWLVVSPRQRLFGLSMDVDAMLAVLAEHFEIDRQRVFLLGHSMGAGQVVSQATRHGQTIAKAVAIGGGRAVPVNAALQHPRWFVSAGERDFGRSGAASLARRLRDGGAQVEYQEVPGVEHMVVVQASLDEVFRFLDE